MAKAKEKLAGKVTHYYGHIGVAIVKLAAGLKVGDTVHIKGHSADFTQSVQSLQLDHAAIAKAAKGKEVGLKVDQKVHENDQVFLAA